MSTPPSPRTSSPSLAGHESPPPPRDEALYEHVACPLCGRDDSSELYRTQKFTGTFLGRVTITLAQCAGCGFVFDSPRPTSAALARYYGEDALASGRVYRSDAADAHYPKLFAHRATFYAPLFDARPSGRLLDVGCGTGAFLRAMAEHAPDGWQLCGLEPSAESHAALAAERAAGTADFVVERGYLGDPLFADASFDAVSLISVLEHLPDPLAAMREVARLLKPNGVALLEVPNTLHPELSLTGYFGLEHVCHFTPGSLQHLLREVGLPEMQIDERVRDRVLRVVAGRDLRSWGYEPTESFAPDGPDVAQAVVRYAEAERTFLDALERRVGGALERWSHEGRTIAIYGAGAHTAELSTRFDLAAHATCLLDGDPTKQGREFLGLPVHAPESIPALGIDAVLLSTHRFTEEMTATVRRCGGPNIAIERCYDDDTSTMNDTSQRTNLAQQIEEIDENIRDLRDTWATCSELRRLIQRPNESNDEWFADQESRHGVLRAIGVAKPGVSRVLACFFASSFRDAIARTVQLVDSTRSGSHEHLTLERLATSIDDARTGPLLRCARNARRHADRGGIVGLRHSEIAHLDLDVAAGEEHRIKIDVDSIDRVMRDIVHYHLILMGHDSPPSHNDLYSAEIRGGVSDIVATLEHGLVQE